MSNAALAVGKTPNDITKKRWSSIHAISNSWYRSAVNSSTYLRRFPEAHAALDRALEISPNDQSTTRQ